MLEDDQNLDTQEETVETADLEEAPASDALETEEAEEEEVLEPLDLGLPEETEEVPDTQATPLSDLKALIQTDPEKALERAAQVEAGLIKLQAQKDEAQGYVESMDNMFKGFERGDKALIDNFERILYEETGHTFETLIEIQGGKSPIAQNDKKYESLEQRIARVEAESKETAQEKAATKWITEKGSIIADRVAKVTGLEFSPEQLWQARSFMPKGADEEAVELAVMQSNPKAYKAAVAKRDGEKGTAPRAAVLPTGRSGAKQTYEHTAQGFNKAYADMRARAG